MNWRYAHNSGSWCREFGPATSSPCPPKMSVSCSLMSYAALFREQHRRKQISIRRLRRLGPCCLQRPASVGTQREYMYWCGSTLKVCADRCLWRNGGVLFSVLPSLPIFSAWFLGVSFLRSHHVFNVSNWICCVSRPHDRSHTTTSTAQVSQSELPRRCTFPAPPRARTVTVLIPYDTWP